jgi:hypothetical protein
VTAWKDLERRICRELGGERSGPQGKSMSDCSDDVPFAVEVKRSSRPGPPVLSKWITQARAHARKERRPWLVVVCNHGSRTPIVALDYWTFVSLARKAGVLRAHVEPVEPDPGQLTFDDVSSDA